MGVTKLVSELQELKSKMITYIYTLLALPQNEAFRVKFTLHN